MTSNVLTAIKNKVLLIEYYLMEYTIAKGDFNVRISVKSLELSFFESCQKKGKRKRKKGTDCLYVSSWMWFWSFSKKEKNVQSCKSYMYYRRKYWWTWQKEVKIIPALSSRDDCHFKHFGVNFSSFFFFFLGVGGGVVVMVTIFVWAHRLENNFEFICK